MKRYLLWFWLLSITLNCQAEDDVKVDNSAAGWFIVIAIIGFIIYIANNTNNTQKESVAVLEKQQLKFDDFKKMGTYVGGHPNLNETIKNVYALKKDDKLLFFTQKVDGVDLPEVIMNSGIPIDDITDIKLEDSSSIEHRITLGRLMLVGIFALAWQKKNRNEMAFVNIVWKIGKFQQETTFMFEGKDAILNAKNAGSALIKMCS